MDDDILENHDIMIDEIVPQELLDDPELKDKLMGLYQHWMENYMNARDKTLSAVANKLHAQFVSDQKKIREELVTQFTEELKATKKDLEEKYMKALKLELAERAKRHKDEISDAKKTQWCALCENESIYYCCWNTSYCSQGCQFKHWRSHRSNCRHPRIVAFELNDNRELAHQEDFPRFQSDDVATDTSEQLIPGEDSKHDQPSFNQVPPIISESLCQPNDLCDNQQSRQCLHPSTTDAPTLIATDVFEEKTPTEDMKVYQPGVGHVPPTVSEANDLSDNQQNRHPSNVSDNVAPVDISSTNDSHEQ